MSTSTIYRVHCEAPDCEASAVVDRTTDTPDGWRKLRSTEHIPDDGRGVRTTRRSNTLTAYERMAGSFTLDLCPDHPDLFAGHEPRTDGRPGGRGRDSTVTVSCACGASLGWTTAGYALVGHHGPSSNSERLWWSHLPADLRAYHIARGEA